MAELKFTDRWQSHRMGSLFSENTNKNSALTRTNALKFTYGTIVNKPKTELTEDVINTYKKYTQVDKNDIIINCC